MCAVGWIGREWRGSGTVTGREKRREKRCWHHIVRSVEVEGAVLEACGGDLVRCK